MHAAAGTQAEGAVRVGVEQRTQPGQPADAGRAGFAQNAQEVRIVLAVTADDGVGKVAAR